MRKLREEVVPKCFKKIEQTFGTNSVAASVFRLSYCRDRFKRQTRAGTTRILETTCPACGAKTLLKELSLEP